MNHQRLFRKEAHQSFSDFGPLLLTHSIRQERVGIVIVGLFLLISLWFFLGTYTEKVRVKGFIDMSPPPIALYAPEKSMMVKQYVKVGQQVRTGERLFRLQPVDDGTQAQRKNIGKTLPQLEQKLIRQIRQKKKMLHAMQPLLQKHYISEKESGALSQALFQDEKLLSELTLQKMQFNRQQYYEIFSPIPGQINELESSVGQWVMGDKPLIKLSPLSFHWVGWLLVPVQFARFIQKGSQISLHYDAYPYQHYGNVEGVIQLFSPLLVHQPTRALPIPMESPFYQVVVRLRAPYLMFQAHTLPIYQGMTFEAILKGEKKSIWRRLKEQYTYGFS